MKKLKKVFINLLACFLCVLSLGVLGACEKEDTITVHQILFQHEYIYKGKKYVYKDGWDYTYKGKVHQIGYAMPMYAFATAYPRAIEVYVHDTDTEENVILFDDCYSGNHSYYIKESIFPDESEMMEVEFSAISTTDYDNRIRKQFKFKDVLSEEAGLKTLTQDEKKGKGTFIGYLSDYPLSKTVSYIFDKQDNLYIYCEGAWRKVIEEEFKQLIIHIKEEA